MIYKFQISDSKSFQILYSKFQISIKIIGIGLLLTLIFFFSQKVSARDYRIKNTYLEVQKTSYPLSVSLYGKEGLKEEATGQATLVDQYKIANIPENEFLDEYPELKQGFQGLKIDIEADLPIFQKENFQETSLLRDIKSLLSLDITPEHKLTKKVNKSKSIQTELDLKKIKTESHYEQLTINNQQLTIKQTLTLTNNSDQDLNLSLLLKNKIEADKVYWNNQEYSLTTHPRKFLNPDRVFFNSGNGESFYDFSDIPDGFSPELWAEKKNSSNLLILSLTVSIPAHSSKTIDPTYGIEITILNVHSHPQAGDNWTVSFETIGTADLTITPQDQATIDDLEFVSLKCGDEEREPQVLENDVIFYPNWECESEGSIIHYVNKAGKHTLRFQFGDQVAYAYNNPGWWNSSWDYRFKYTIDNSNVGETLTDFPLHIDLTNDAPSAFWTHVSSETGDDIRIVDEDDSTNLSSVAHLEGFSKASSKGHIWVKRTIAAAGDTEFVYIYYGNSGASSPFSDTTKQDTYNSGYKGVWHLDEDPSGSAPQMLDGTSNDNDGTSAGTMLTEDQVAGEINGSLDFDGSDDYIDVANEANFDFERTVPFSIFAWIKAPDNSGSEESIVAKGINGSPYAGYELLMTEGGQLSVFINNDWNGNNSLYEYTSDTIDDDVWHQVGWTYDGSSSASGAYCYIDGIQKSTTVERDTLSASILNNDNLRIGARGDASVKFTGIIDEVRISNTARSAEWIEFAYLSDKGDGGTAGSEEEPSNQTPTVSNVYLNAGSSFSPIENTIASVNITGQVVDSDGAADCTIVSALAYRSGVSSTCSADDNNCYRSISCNTSASGSIISCTCPVSIWFHADPTDAGDYSAQWWEAAILATDSASNTAEGDSSSSTACDLNTLLGLGVTTSIAYSNVAPGSDTGSTNQTTVVTVTGNAAIDCSLKGIDVTSGSTGGTVAASKQHWDLSAFTYGGTESTLTTSDAAVELVASKPTTNPSDSTDIIYWGIGVAAGTPDAADYSGYNTFTATGD